MVEKFNAPARLNYQEQQFGFTALHFSVLFGNAGAVRVLLDQDNVDVNKTDKQGRTALDLAVLRLNDPSFDGLIQVPDESRRDWGIVQRTQSNEIVRLFLDDDRAESRSWELLTGMTAEGLHVFLLKNTPIIRSKDGNNCVFTFTNFRSALNLHRGNGLDEFFSQTLNVRQGGYAFVVGPDLHKVIDLLKREFETKDC